MDQGEFLGIKIEDAGGLLNFDFMKTILWRLQCGSHVRQFSDGSSVDMEHHQITKVLVSNGKRCGNHA